MKKWILIVVLLAVIAGFFWQRAIPALRQGTIPTEQFGEVLYRRPRLENGVALVLSPESARRAVEYQSGLNLLNLRAITTFEIDPENYLKSLTDSDGCAVVGGELERFNQSLQNTLGFDTFHRAAIVGYGSGALLSYVARFQSPDRFEGTISFKLCPNSTAATTLCGTDQLAIADNGTLSVIGDSELPTLSDAFLISLDGEARCTPSGRVVPPGVELRAPTEPFTAQIKRLIPRILQNSEGNGEPVIELPGKEPLRLAIFLSGDGGWAGIDKETGGFLSEHGFGVLGFNSLRYFWHQKSPEEAAGKIEQLIKRYQRKWSLTETVLIGYSLGADVLPFIYNRLSEHVKNQTSAVILLNPESSTDLQVHIADWVGVPTTAGEMSLNPEILQIPANKLMCVSGEDDSTGACDELDPKKFKVLKLPGGHHFDGEYEKVGATITSFVADLTSAQRNNK